MIEKFNTAQEQKHDPEERKAMKHLFQFQYF